MAAQEKSENLSGKYENAVCPVPNFHGASIITAQGKEIPITEKMVRQACNQYIKAWETRRKFPGRNTSPKVPTSKKS
jgi:hypothetical protein